MCHGTTSGIAGLAAVYRLLKQVGQTSACERGKAPIRHRVVSRVIKQIRYMKKGELDETVSGRRMQRQPQSRHLLRIGSVTESFYDFVLEEMRRQSWRLVFMNGLGV